MSDIKNSDLVAKVLLILADRVKSVNLDAESTSRKSELEGSESQANHNNELEKPSHGNENERSSDEGSTGDSSRASSRRGGHALRHRASERSCSKWRAT